MPSHLDDRRKMAINRVKTVLFPTDKQKGKTRCETDRNGDTARAKIIDVYAHILPSPKKRRPMKHKAVLLIDEGMR